MNWFSLNEKDVALGSAFSDYYYQNKAFVAIVNHSFKEAFFSSSENPIGKKFSLGKKEYTIVGVLEEAQMERGNQIYIPDTTVAERIKHSNEITMMTVFLSSTADNALWKNRLTYLLLKKFNIQDAASAGFEVSSFAEFAETIKSTTNMMTSFLLFIGGMSLLI